MTFIAHFSNLCKYLAKSSVLECGLFWHFSCVIIFGVFFSFCSELAYFKFVSSSSVPKLAGLKFHCLFKRSKCFSDVVTFSAICRILQTLSDTGGKFSVDFAISLSYGRSLKLGNVSQQRTCTCYPVPLQYRFLWRRLHLVLSLISITMSLHYPMNHSILRGYHTRGCCIRHIYLVLIEKWIESFDPRVKTMLVWNVTIFASFSKSCESSSSNNEVLVLPFLLLILFW